MWVFSNHPLKALAYLCIKSLTIVGEIGYIFIKSVKALTLYFLCKALRFFPAVHTTRNILLPAIEAIAEVNVIENGRFPYDDRVEL
jgi:hypothetical protein